MKVEKNLEGFEDKLIIKSASSRMSIEDLLKIINNVAKNKQNDLLQIFDPKMIINRMHLFGAYANALSTFKEETNRSEKINIETMLFAAMNRQIKEAIEIIGAKSPDYFIIFSNNPNLYKLLSKHTYNIKDHNPTFAHAILTAKKFGIKSDKKDLDYKILQSITMSKLDF